MSSRHCPPMRCSQIHSHALQLRDAAEQERPMPFHLDPFLWTYRPIVWTTLAAFSRYTASSRSPSWIFSMFPGRLFNAFTA